MSFPPEKSGAGGLGQRREDEDTPDGDGERRRGKARVPQHMPARREVHPLPTKIEDVC